MRRAPRAVALVGLLALAACNTTEPLAVNRKADPLPAKFASIVVDGKTGQTLQQTAANERRYPASLTKMMTLYLAFEALNAGRIAKDTALPVSARAAGQAPSKLGLKAGQSIDVDTAMRALAVKSANDVAVVVAEALGGSEDAFAVQMTAKARALGMGSTVFRNASGLPDAAQVTTARDMAVLGLRLRRDFPEHFSYFGQRSFTHNGRAIRGHNRALDMIPGANGIKTGYTRASGFNLVTSVEKNGRLLVGVVLGEDTAVVRDRRMTELMAQYMRPKGF